MLTTASTVRINITPFRRIRRLASAWMLLLRRCIPTPTVTESGITESNAKCVEEIYRCIVQKKPYKVYKQYMSVRGKEIPDDVRDIISANKEIYFEFVAEGHYELLGQTISLKGVFGIFGACIKNLDQVFSSEKEFEIMLETVERKKMYESVMLFKTDDEVNEFRKDKEHIKTMEKAEEITSIE